MTCHVCGIKESVTTYCVIEGDMHVTYGSEFINPDILKGT